MFLCFHSVRQNYSKTKWPEIMISINSSSKNIYSKIVYMQTVEFSTNKIYSDGYVKNGGSWVVRLQIDDMVT